MRHDARSAEAAAYRHLYKTARWRRLRAEQLQAEPLCRTCKAAGRTVAATVCNHINKAAKSTEEGFFAGPFSSLCAPCHNSVAQRDEKREEVGRRPIQACGPDGWPI